MGSLRQSFWLLFLVTICPVFFAGACYGQTVAVTPQTVSALPGQSVSLSARVLGYAARPRLLWIVRGPRTPGANWGKLQFTGNTATYTAPSKPPPGKIVIQVQLLGKYGQPVASTQVPVQIVPTRPGTAGAPPPARPPPPVTRPPPPVPAKPTPVAPRPPKPPPRVIVPPTPPRVAVPPKPPPPLSATARISQVKSAVLLAQKKCLARQSGAPYLAQAERVWSGLTAGQRLQVVGGLARAQLGRSVPVRVLPPDRRIRNVARVTGQGRSVSITFGTAGANTSQSVLDEPLTKPASLGWSYASLLEFLCYENEVARIRHQLAPHCSGMYDSVKMQLDRSRAYAANAKDPAQARAQIASYKRFMASVPARYGIGRDKRMAASWLFERIAVERGRGAKTCDMPLSAGGQAYSSAIASKLEFEHDALAVRLGRAVCPCPR